MKKNDWQSMNLKALNQNLHLDIGILLFDDVELLDFAGPYEVFCMANVVVSMQARDVPPFLVFTIADKPRTIRTRAGLRVLPDLGLEDCPNMDLLVVPGGPGVRQEMKNGKLIDCLINFAHLNRRVASVCTGALLLGKAGLLKGRQATTHWSALEELAQLCPETIVVGGKRVVDSGSILTAAGVSAGIDLALYLVGGYLNGEISRFVAERMEYVLP
jgi:transcriptional regulator GlxA family with amidase domain